MTLQPQELQARVIVIAGAGSELSTVVARDFAAQGASLALINRSAGRQAAQLSALALADERLLPLMIDLTDASGAQTAAQAVLARFGRVDGLINLVGGWTGGKRLTDTPPDDLETMLAQHAFSTFHLARAFVPPMLERGWGRFAVVSSPSATRPGPGSSAYAAAKAAQESLIMTLAQELRGSGVTANALQVSTIDVERKKVSAPDGANAGWSTPEEISAALLYLFSAAGGAVNGARLPLFGV